MLSREIIDSLRCPLGKFPLEQDGDFLVCTQCGVKFPIKDGIPVLLIDGAVLPEGINDISELKCYIIIKHDAEGILP